MTRPVKKISLASHPSATSKNNTSLIHIKDFKKEREGIQDEDEKGDRWKLKNGVKSGSSGGLWSERHGL